MVTVFKTVSHQSMMSQVDLIKLGVAAKKTFQFGLILMLKFSCYRLIITPLLFRKLVVGVAHVLKIFIHMSTG